MYINFKPLCHTPNTNVILHVNYTSILKRNILNKMLFKYMVMHLLIIAVLFNDTTENKNYK